jgi:hypothetical protein
MKLRNSALCIATLLVLTASPCFSQGSSSFNVEAYRQFLGTHRDLSPGDLASLHSAGRFVGKIGADISTASYFDSINAVFHLTGDELSLLRDHGFVVSERLRRNSFGNAFLEIYDRDLPVFVSSDAILHALHMSWDAVLMDVEKKVLIQKLDTLLARLHDQLPALAVRYASVPAMKPMLADFDVYLTIPRALLGKVTSPKLAENQTTVQDLLAFVKAERPSFYRLFSDHERAIDFSQFTVRGHYTQSPELSGFFQAMIWLGRTEICLIAPKSDDVVQQSGTDIQRQTIDAVLLKEAADLAGAFPLLEEIDGILRRFVGESDNVTLPNIQSLMQDTHLTGAGELLDSTQLGKFQETLSRQSFAFQRINSQILMSDPMSPDQIKPASAFLLLGQRFVIDSYTTGNVVYDKIMYNNAKIRRMLPSSLDVLFALGNDAAAQLLEPDLNHYHYSSNLAAVRYLVDSYEPGFWESTVYNGWLNSIRALNPPSDRKGLPAFMQTAAWWQEKMNTQLASWAQLRHDFILYAKQSFSAGVICSYPESYVEPIPGFYKAVKAFADGAAAMFQLAPLQNIRIAQYFTSMSAIVDTLRVIAEKELARIPLTDAEDLFLKTMLYQNPHICGGEFRGWYPRLFYTGESGFMMRDLIVADVHTAPTDAAGSPVGWVLHAGTGPLNLGVVVTELPNGRMTAFIGPVLSYYEHVSTNFKRLTDEEWRTAYAVAPSFRPPFIRLYLADSAGTLHEGVQSLLTGIDVEPVGGTIPLNLTLAQNFPNPFNSSTIIMFAVPQSMANSTVKLVVYDLQGRLVKQLLNSSMPAGNYATRWNGTTESGAVAASGVYFYHLVVGNQRAIGKMSFVK